MANETRTIQEVGKAGEVSTSPKAMQASKPDPDTLQKKGGTIELASGRKLVVRSLTELLQEEKPHSALILTGGNPQGNQFYKVLDGYISDKELFEKLAEIISRSCAESGIESSTLHVGRHPGDRVPDLERLIAEAAGLGKRASSPRASLGEKLHLICEAKRILEKASSVVSAAIHKEEEKRDFFIEDGCPMDLEKELEGHSGSIILQVPGCLCCFDHNSGHSLAGRLNYHFRWDFGKGRGFILAPDLENLKNNVQHLVDRAVGELVLDHVRFSEFKDNREGAVTEVELRMEKRFFVL